MSEAHYKLFRHSGGRPFYAEVTVISELVCDGPRVTVAADATDGGDGGWRAAAERGAWYGLHHTSPSIALNTIALTITSISGLFVDTCESAVAAAACHAAWNALGVLGTHPPRFQGREIIFDGSVPA